MFVDAAELARLKGYLSKRAAGGGIAPGVPQGPDFSHGGQPPMDFNYCLKRLGLLSEYQQSLLSYVLHSGEANAIDRRFL